MKAYVVAKRTEQIPYPANQTWVKVPIGSKTQGHQWTDVMMSPAAYDMINGDELAAAWWGEVHRRIRR